MNIQFQGIQPKFGMPAPSDPAKDPRQSKGNPVGVGSTGWAGRPSDPARDPKHPKFGGFLAWFFSMESSGSGGSSVMGPAHQERRPNAWRFWEPRIWMVKAGPENRRGECTWIPKAQYDNRPESPTRPRP